MNSLTDLEIEEICIKQNIPLNAICSKDDIRDLKSGYYIINLQSKDSDGPGTHWTALYYSNGSSINIYYDSFGFMAPSETEQILKPYIYNSKQIQNINTSSCGFYCLAFIKFISKFHNKVKAFDTFVNLFDLDTEKNEKILYSILYN